VSEGVCVHVLHLEVCGVVELSKVVGGRDNQNRSSVCAKSELTRRRDAKLLAEKSDLKTPTRDITNTQIQTLLGSCNPSVIALPILIDATQERVLIIFQIQITTCKSKHCYALASVPSVPSQVVRHLKETAFLSLTT
jgi:hypothetical protein